MNYYSLEAKDYKAIINACRELGCCDACCVRYCALRKPTIFGDTRQFIKENTDSESNGSAAPKDLKKPDDEEAEGTPAKRMKRSDVCVSCLGILQEDGWPECLAMSKEVMDNKKYETSTFACALSAPLATIIREKVVLLKLADKFPTFDSDGVTPLKEAWKWSLGARLATHLGLTLDSGACAPLFITLSMEYDDDSLEAEVFAPSAAQLQRRQRRQRAAAPVTRCLLDRALDGISLSSLLSLLSWTDVPGSARGPARCVAVHAHHAPIYLAGRYLKLSRELPQSPWVLHGKRMMESSVQEIIFQPIADLYRFTPEEAEHRLKFQSAGREDVDVRCLGDGRPFAIEIADPRRALTIEELARACEEICRSGKVAVYTLTPINKERLAELKAGEETKLKTYEALCIKLTHSPDDICDGARPSSPVVVSPRDLSSVLGSRPSTRVLQRTPLRVLHRRALHVRERAVTVLRADPVPGHSALFTVVVVTPAGTYVKEWCHGEAGRTRPALPDALRARADILALDVTSVQLDWP